MELVTVLMADAAEQSLDGRFHALGAGIHGILAPGIPCMVPSMAFIIQLRFVQDECESEYSLYGEIVGPHKADLGKSNPILLKPRWPNHDVPTRSVVSTVVIKLAGLQLAQEGEYVFRVIVNESEIGILRFGVVVESDVLEKAEQAQ